jgi:hypothetical protein
MPHLLRVVKSAGCPILCRFCKGWDFTPPTQPHAFPSAEPPCCRNLAERTGGRPYPASSRTHHPVGAPSFAAFAKGGISHRQHNRMPFRASEPHRRHNLVERPHPSPGGAGIYACGKTALSLRLQPLRWLREPSINPPLNFLQPYFPTSTAKNE